MPPDHTTAFKQIYATLGWRDREEHTVSLFFQPSDALYLRSLLSSALHQMQDSVDKEEVAQVLQEKHEIPQDQADSLWR